MNTDTESLLLWLESSSGSRIPLRGHVSMGRSRTNTVPIECEKASRRHALARLDEQGKCLVIDLGSSNGTYINGSRITHQAHLQVGDCLEIGSERFTLRAWTGEGEYPNESDGAGGAALVPCWIIIGDQEKPDSAEKNGAGGDSFKTMISWAQVCQNVVERNKATAPAGFEGKLFAYWRDPQRDAGIAAAVAKSLRELQTVQTRQRFAFRLALHFGMVVIGSSGPRRRKELIGTEVNFAFQMQRLAWDMISPCLISEEANRRISALIQTRALEPCGLPAAQGERQYYSL